MIEEIYEHLEKIIVLLDSEPREDLIIIEELAHQMEEELEMVFEK